MDTNFVRIKIQSAPQYKAAQEYLASEGYTEMGIPVQYKEDVAIIGISQSEKTVHQIKWHIVNVLRRFQASIYPSYMTFENNTDLMEFLEIRKSPKRVYKKKAILGEDGAIYDSAMDYLLINGISPRNINVLYNALSSKKKYKGKELRYNA